MLQARAVAPEARPTDVAISSGLRSVAIGPAISPGVAKVRSKGAAAGCCADAVNSADATIATPAVAPAMSAAPAVTPAVAPAVAEPVPPEVPVLEVPVSEVAVAVVEAAAVMEAAGRCGRGCGDGADADHRDGDSDSDSGAKRLHFSLLFRRVGLLRRHDNRSLGAGEALLRREQAQVGSIYAMYRLSVRMSCSVPPTMLPEVAAGRRSLFKVLL